MNTVEPGTNESNKDLNLLDMLKGNQEEGGASNFLESSGLDKLDADGDGQVSLKEIIKKFTESMDPSMVEKLGLDSDDFDIGSMFKQVFGPLFGFNAMSMGAPLGESTVLKDELTNTETLDPETGEPPVIAVEPTTPVLGMNTNDPGLDPNAPDMMSGPKAPNMV